MSMDAPIPFAVVAVSVGVETPSAIVNAKRVRKSLVPAKMMFFERRAPSVHQSCAFCVAARAATKLFENGTHSKFRCSQKISHQLRVFSRFHGSAR
jgi:hypothetical protein